MEAQKPDDGGVQTENSQQRLSDTATSVEAEDRFRSSWFARHWRGDLSLGVSYWINGGLANVVVIVLLKAASALISGYQPLTGFLFITTMWLSVLTFAIWQMVGIWRSASKHFGRGGRRFWAGAAKVMVVFGLLQNGGIAVRNAVPQVLESWDILCGDPRVGKFTLRPLNGAKEIEFSGGIQFGAADELQKILDAAPMVRVIHLNSPGGRVAEATRMRDLIRERKLDTYVSSNCLSACTVAFLGGAHRFIHPSSGRLGFHGVSFPGMSKRDFDPIVAAIKADAVNTGVKIDFIERAYLEPEDSMWFPTTEEAVSSGYATGLSNGQFAISGFGPSPKRKDLVRALKKTPVWVAVERADPTVFERAAGTYLDGAIKGLQEGRVLSAIRADLVQLVMKYAPHASDEALLELIYLMIDEMHAINSADPDACHFFIFPEAGHFVDVRLYFDVEMQQRDLKATERILSTGIGHQVVIATEAEIQTDMERLFERFAERHSPSFLAKFADYGSKEIKNETCNISEAFYTEILSLPRENALRILRYLFSQ